jgi:hypothetical protein
MSVGLLDRVRRPEYTGANRCIPCTAVNVVIAGVVGALLGVVWLPVGVAAAGLSLAAIYLRGYLVPGTPTITKRYFPDRVLAYFDKAPDPGTAPSGVEGVEATLYELGAVEECPDRDDICLSGEFQATWRAEIEDCREVETTTDDAAELVGADPADLAFSEYYEGGPFLANVGSETVATWDSRAAYVADVAATRLLEERDPEWSERDRQERNAVLNSLRMFIETCPTCGGAVELGEETVESCCRDLQVAAAECVDCGSRVFEVET